MTNSTYSVIWNHVEVESVEKHWAKEMINDMAARLVITDVDTCTPNLSITRGDFAKYGVKALGLQKTNLIEESTFSDVGKNVLSAKVINGTSPNMISPKNSITYAESLTAINNLLTEAGLMGRH